MRSKAEVLGHPAHIILIVFPVGLLVMSFFFDILGLIRNSGTLFTVSYYMVVSGVVSGIIAGAFGLVDFLSIPRHTRAKRIGLTHAIGNVGVLILFGASWAARNGHIFDPKGGAILCSLFGFGLILITGWLGGELVDRLGIGVHPGAHMDAPSSLTHEAIDTSASGRWPVKKGGEAA
jgi:uncharacterized membrane protein